MPERNQRDASIVGVRRPQPRRLLGDDSRRPIDEKTGKHRRFINGNRCERDVRPIVPELAKSCSVIRMDFLGCGRSDRMLSVWPADLWHEWGEQAAELLGDLGLSRVDVIGCSGGALAALNLFAINK